MRNEYDFSDSQRGAMVKRNKERISIRLDPDIIERGQGTDSTGRLTLVLGTPAIDPGEHVVAVDQLSLIQLG